MDSWWAELVATLSLQIQEQHKAELEKLTGCNPILLRPLLHPSRIIPDSQSSDPVKQYAEMIEHFSATLSESDEVENVRKSILVYVIDKYGNAIWSQRSGNRMFRSSPSMMGVVHVLSGR
jgi:hypothetical protein